MALPAESIARSSDHASTVSFGPFTFDRVNGLLKDGAREIPLPPRALGVLDALVSRAGIVVPRQELIDTIWRDAFVTDTSLAEAVSVLRQALRDDPQSPQFIQTVHRRGYRFVAEVASHPAIQPVAPAAQNRVADDGTAPSISQHLLPWGIAALCAVLAALAVWQYTHFRAPLAPVVRMRIEPAPGTSFDSRAPALALSPDGLTVAWSACDSSCRLYVRGIDQLDAKSLPGTDGASAPFFSPDGRWIGFFGGGKLQKVAIGGGMPIVVTEASQPFGAVWLPDGHIVFAASEYGGLMRVSDSGSDSEQLTLPSTDAGEVRHCWPAIAPGGQSLLFTVAIAPHDESPGRIALMRMGQRTAWQTIVENADTARAVSQNYIAFSRGTEIHAIAFDRARQKLAGADQTVVSNVARAQFALSSSGAVVYAIAGEAARPSLAWIGGTTTSLSGDLAVFHDLALTPDGTRIAGVSSGDLWVGDINRGTTTRLTHGGINVSPTWNSEASSVYYAVRTSGAFEAWQRDSSGTTPAKLALSAAARHRHVFPTSVSRDQTRMAYTESGGTTRGDVKVVSLSSGAMIAAVETPFDELNGALSPDGRLLAYQSDESGRWEIYVLELDDRQRLPISSAGGERPMWSSTGDSLVYQSGTATMRVAMDGSGQPVGEPMTISTPPDAVILGISGDRLLARLGGHVPAALAVLTLEWVRDLQRILGPPTAALPR